MCHMKVERYPNCLHTSGLRDPLFVRCSRASSVFPYDTGYCQPVPTQYVLVNQRFCRTCKDIRSKKTYLHVATTLSDLSHSLQSSEATAGIEGLEITDVVPMDVDDAPMDVDKN